MEFGVLLFQREKLGVRDSLSFVDCGLIFAKPVELCHDLITWKK